MANQPIPNNPTLVTEEASQQELASTQVERGVARWMAIGFCVLLLVPVVAQLASGRIGDFEGKQWPPDRESLAELGKTLGDRSVLKQWVQPRLQAMLTWGTGVGNESVTIGQDGWLYFTPGLRAIFGHGLLDAGYLKSKAKGMIDKDGLAVAHPDPLPAFRQLAADCERLGIRLVVVPVPDKGTMEHARLGARGKAENADLERFRKAVAGYGARVLRLEGLEGGYLRQDTHWTPRFMDGAARLIAEEARGLVWRDPEPLYKRRRETVRSPGDLVALLQLPKDQRLYGEESAAVEVVETVGKPGPAEVMLLGDSFSLIYSGPPLTWGRGAGLGEHLAYHLNAPVDVIAMNGAGATVRQELVRAGRTGRLAATRVLVYEFAVRDLYLNDWPVVELGQVERKLISREAVGAPVAAVAPAESATPAAAVAAAPAAAAVPADSERLTVRATVVQMSRALNPGTAPYEDALMYGKVKIDSVEAGNYGKKEAIVVFVAMRKRVLVAGAGHKVGESLRLRLVRLKSAPEEIRTMQRSDDTEDFDLVPYFVEEELP